MIARTALIAVFAAMAALPASGVSAADIREDGRVVEMEVARLERPGVDEHLNDAERTLVLRADPARFSTVDMIMERRNWERGTEFLEERRLNR